MNYVVLQGLLIIAWGWLSIMKPTRLALLVNRVAGSMGFLVEDEGELLGRGQSGSCEGLAYLIVGMLNSAPSLMPDGHR